MASRLGLGALLAALLVASAQEKPAKPDEKKEEVAPAVEESPVLSNDGGPTVPLALPILLAANPLAPVPWPGLELLATSSPIRLIIKADRKPLVSDVLDKLKTDNQLVRKRLILLLGKLDKDEKRHEDVKEALPALMAIIYDLKDDLKVRTAAFAVLDGYDPSEQVSAFAQAASGEAREKEWRDASCQRLGQLYGSSRIGEEDRKRIKAALEKALLDADADVQDEAARALELIETGEEKATFHLRVKKSMEKRLSAKEAAKQIEAADPALKVQVAKDQTIVVTGTLRALYDALKKAQVNSEGSRPLKLLTFLEILERDKPGTRGTSPKKLPGGNEPD